MVDTYFASGGIHPDWVFGGNGLTTVTNPDAAGDDNTSTYIQWLKDLGAPGIAGPGGGNYNFVGINFEARPLVDTDINTIVLRTKISYSSGRSVANRAGSKIQIGISDLAGTFDLYSADMQLVADGTTDTFKAVFTLADLQENDPGLTWADFAAACNAGLYFRAWFTHVDVEAQGAPVNETIRIREASFSPTVPRSPWPIVETFESGVSGTTADSTNTPITGIHFFENYAFSELIFTDTRAHSGTKSVTSLSDSYEHFQVPFDNSAIDALDEDFYFWYHYEQQAPFSGGGSTVHQLYAGALGESRSEDYNYYPSVCFVTGLDADTNTWTIQFEDANVNGNGPVNTEFIFNVPSDIWMKVRVLVTGAGDITYILTGSDEIVYGTYSSVVDNLMAFLTPRQYFAFHLLWPQQYLPGSGYGQSWIDNINYTPGPAGAAQFLVNAHVLWFSPLDVFSTAYPEYYAVYLIDDFMTDVTGQGYEDNPRYRHLR